MIKVYRESTVEILSPKDDKYSIPNSIQQLLNLATDTSLFELANIKPRDQRDILITLKYYFSDKEEDQIAYEHDLRFPVGKVFKSIIVRGLTIIYQNLEEKADLSATGLSLEDLALENFHNLSRDIASQLNLEKEIKKREAKKVGLRKTRAPLQKEFDRTKFGEIEIDLNKEDIPEIIKEVFEYSIQFNLEEFILENNFINSSQWQRNWFLTTVYYFTDKSISEIAKIEGLSIQRVNEIISSTLVKAAKVLTTIELKDEKFIRLKERLKERAFEFEIRKIAKLEILLSKREYNIEPLVQNLIHPRIILERLGITRNEYRVLRLAGEMDKIYSEKGWIEKCLETGDDTKAEEAAEMLTNKSYSFYLQMRDKGYVISKTDALGIVRNSPLLDNELIFLLEKEGILIRRAGNDSQHTDFILTRHSARAKQIAQEYINRREG